MGTILNEPEARNATADQAVLRGMDVVLRGASWDDYVTWDRHFEELGYGRVAYCDGILEIMSISKLHEKIKTILHHIIVNYAIHIGRNPDSAGSATIGNRAKDAGKEPDDSFWFDREASGNTPDLIVEVVVRSEAIDKLNFYSRFEIPELWIWKDDKLKVYLLDGSTYQESGKSGLFPELDLKVVETCCEADNLGAAIREFREYLQN